MIDSKSLRIGNFVCTGNPKEIFVTSKDVDFKKDVDIVNEICDYSIDIFNDGNFNSASFFGPYQPKNINPIPLTDEWFIRLGFVLKEDMNSKDYPFAHGIFTIKTKSKLCKEVKIAVNQNGYHFYSMVYFEFVHELQNFFFSITKNELNLDYKM